MIYEELLNKIFSLERFGKNSGLSGIKALMDELGNPQDKLRFIHIAGTNGKGSCANYISNGLKQCGYKTGLFTSPFIVSFNERFQINGECIKNDELVTIGSSVLAAAEKLKKQNINIKQFEAVCAIGFLYFARSLCDYVVLECGMGGGSDSTNIVTTAEASVIATVSLDHMNVLGDTVFEIAREKSGIIKKNIPVFVYRDIDNIFESRAGENNSPFTALDFSRIGTERVTDSFTEFSYKGMNYKISMKGAHQVYNACLAADVLGYLKVPYEKIAAGLAETKVPGRFELLLEKPVIYVDGAHNREGAQSLLNAVEFHGISAPVLVLSVGKGKDYEGICSVLEKCPYEIILTSFDENAAVAPGILKQCIKKGIIIPSLEEVFEKISSEKTYIFFGSLYQISKIKLICHSRKFLKGK